MDPAYYVVVHNADNEGSPTNEVGRFPCKNHANASDFADELDNILNTYVMYKYYIEIVDA